MRDDGLHEPFELLLPLLSLHCRLRAPHRGRDISAGQQVSAAYAGVSTAILFFTKTNSGGTEDVWFYDVTADGYSLDDKRTPIEQDDLDDVLARWVERASTERDRARTDKSFTVPKSEIVEQGYDLSINRYKEVVYNKVEHRAPLDIIADIEKLEAEIADGLAELKGMLS